MNVTPQSPEPPSAYAEAGVDEEREQAASSSQAAAMASQSSLPGGLTSVGHPRGTGRCAPLSTTRRWYETAF